MLLLLLLFLAEAVIGGDGGLGDSHLAAVAALTQIRSLTVKVRHTAADVAVPHAWV